MGLDVGTVSTVTIVHFNDIQFWGLVNLSGKSLELYVITVNDRKVNTYV